MQSANTHKRSRSRIPPYNGRRTLAWFYHQGKWRAQTDSNKPSRAELLLLWARVLEWALVSKRPFSCTLQLSPPSILVDCVCTPGDSAKVKTGSQQQDWANNKIEPKTRLSEPKTRLN
jgi:hypothetical protein